MTDRRALVYSSSAVPPPVADVPTGDKLLFDAFGPVGGGPVLAYGSFQIQAGATLSTTSSGNINLPNNASARFQIESTGVGSTVTSANLNTLTNGGDASALHTHAYVPTSRTISTTAPLTGGGDLSANRTLAISDFVASGASHARGAVPDPGAGAGSTKFLREDATWAVPSSSTADPLQLTGLGLGVAPDVTLARLKIKGIGAGASTYEIYGQDSGNTLRFTVRDDGQIKTTMTLAAAPGATDPAWYLDATSAGSSGAVNPRGIYVIARAGYTGGLSTTAIEGDSLMAGTSFNAGVEGVARGAARNIGLSGLAYGGTANVGVYASLSTDTGGLASSAALVCDNATSGQPLIECRANSVRVAQMDSAGRLGLGTVPSYRLDVYEATLAADTALVRGVTTFASSGSDQYAYQLDATTAGSGAGAQYAMRVRLIAGYTGANQCVTAYFTNACSPTGTAQAVAFAALSAGTTYNLGAAGFATGGTRNVGGYLLCGGSGTAYATSIAGDCALVVDNFGGSGVLLRGQGQSTEYFRFDATGRLGLNVTPTARLHARGADTSASTSLVLLENSTPTTLFKLTDDGRVQYQSHAGSTGFGQWATDKGQTTDAATALQLATVTLSDNTVYLFRAAVQARESGGTDRATYEFVALVYRQGAGNATIQGSVTNIFTAIGTVGSATWTATFTVTGSTVRVSVTGAAATTINWSCNVDWQGAADNG